MTLHASNDVCSWGPYEAVTVPFSQSGSLILIWLWNLQNTTEVSYASRNSIIFRIHDDHLLNKMKVLMFLQRNEHHYPAANFTIALLMTSLTAQTPWTVYWRSRKIIKHCLPITKEIWIAMKFKTVPETKQITEEYLNQIKIRKIPVPLVVWSRALTKTLLPTASDVKSLTLVQTLAVKTTHGIYFHKMLANCVDSILFHCFYDS